jgi:hypothetical protein
LHSFVLIARASNKSDEIQHEILTFALQQTPVCFHTAAAGRVGISQGVSDSSKQLNSQQPHSSLAGEHPC